MTGYKKLNAAVRRAFDSERWLWDLERLQDGSAVIICRDNTNTASNYSVHTYRPEADGLFNGSYDLTIDEAMTVAGLRSTCEAWWLDHYNK